MKDHPMRGKDRETGAVMVWALIFVIVTAGMIISHSAYMASHRQSMDVQLKRKPLAANLARAAISDGLSWFQAQATQPVTAFAPVFEPTATPPVLDTEDPTVGLVREFEIRGNLWGRYEIRRQEAMDASLQYGVSAPGSVWELVSRGYVYRVLDTNVPFDQSPNRVVSTARVESLIRSVPLNLPATAAVGIDDPFQISLGPGGRVLGTTSVAAVAAPLTTLIPPVLVGLVGTPLYALLPSYDSQATSVFRMGLADLRDVSDLAIVAGSSGWLGSRQLAENSVLVHDGDLVINSSQQVTGSMLLVVIGNLTVQPGTDSNIDGVIFVTGNTDIRGPFQLHGMLIGKGTVYLQGNGAGQDAVITYDSGAVQRLVQSLGRYRGSRSMRSLDTDSDAWASGPASTGAGTTVGTNVMFGGGVVLGANVSIGNDCYLRSSVTIGDNSIIAPVVRIGDQAQIGLNVQVGGGTSIGQLAVVGDGAVIGSNVIIGVGAQILAGANVPNGTIVRAGETYP
ncbi:MAG: hypothetical protein R3F56_08450 [Planctomycetota bacterium]